ncbi:biotin-dependent carboxyltransferase family protein [Sulfitobacter aestuariivivens]|uniref:Biotin-dependent carboxyltransferase n=1 Tax=Sulfitobacter aestuariivivens TaxID=2766981 RepID=A0A927D5T7_9RHOB|nr:biotin-dependent carboxyltransferase family protein [Sulfitobacter aestuariivivens]MBD3664926.1 biotin-dependent carboxyltransferase [Sulfitobacter aestuariivivens]
MTRTLHILQGGPTLSVQDLGRPGYRAQGLTVAGAMDPLALYEGAALLGQPPTCAAIEMAGTGSSFQCDETLRIALTGAAMSASIDGEPLVWNASHILPAGATLTIGGAREGSYGYLHLGGGIATEPVLGARATHLRAGVGRALETDDALPVGPDTSRTIAMTLPRDNRFSGGALRCVASMQTGSFASEVLERFCETTFKRDPRANRMGVRMDHVGPGFTTQGALSIVSEVVVPGDIQLTGDGAPFVLMCECQTTGGYPRIGTVIPCDLPRVAQAPAGSAIGFEFMDMDTAIATQQRYTEMLKALPRNVTPLVRDPAKMRDLLSYQLVSGAISARANPFDKET